MLEQDLIKIREKTPLVHHITNWVVTNFTANVTLAMGASPVMAHAKEEAKEMAAIANALVLNIGTLTHPLVDAMIIAGKSANENNIPVILDPVGCGATKLRTECTSKILNEVKVNVVRGNLSEVASVAGENAEIRGVDSTASGINAKQLTFNLASELKCIVATTGEVDYISDGTVLYSVKNGHPLLSKVTGTGCAATGVMAAFCAVNKDYTEASANALAYFGLAAEHAAENSLGPGTFAANLLDELHRMTPMQLKKGAKIVEEKSND